MQNATNGHTSVVVTRNPNRPASRPTVRVRTQHVVDFLLFAGVASVLALSVYVIAFLE
ncbi:MAG TPA: hypothetical protein VN812_03255 [Candidatus Acidoferrales bacterium]|nr:hypothetical protein [Candidatus Acidoferrales bacterium]